MQRKNKLTIDLGERRILVYASEPEREAIDRYCSARNLTRAALVREVVQRARDRRPLESAAEEAAMPVQTWIRVMILEAVGYTDLFNQLEKVHQ